MLFQISMPVTADEVDESPIKRSAVRGEVKEQGRREPDGHIMHLHRHGHCQDWPAATYLLQRAGNRHTTLGRGNQPARQCANTHCRVGMAARDHVHDYQDYICSTIRIFCHWHTWTLCE